VAHRKMRELLRQLCQIDTALKRIYDASTPATWR
jgi:hypothetical protein